MNFECKHAIQLVDLYIAATIDKMKVFLSKNMIFYELLTVTF